jgi:oxygen-independent coproporphyrinogen III oxidase
MAEPYSIYIHIPFCQQRCFYCDFNTVAGQDSKIDAYLKALKQEIDVLTRHFDEQIPVHTLYIGGGTPSYIAPHHIVDIMELVNQRFAVIPNSEITIEANPGTLDEEKLNMYFASGINRISLGVQSVDDVFLKKLGRIHTYEDVERNIELARKCGFENISADLIFGLPDQSMQHWQDSLACIQSLSLEHLSLYSLTIEEGTPFGTWAEEGKLIASDEDLVADQYSYAISWLAAHGYEQYEISNWRRMDSHIDYASKHNNQYWLNQPYIGFGLGSHSCFEKKRIANTPILGEYFKKISNNGPGAAIEMPASISVDELSIQDEMKETMMLGLRLVKTGVSRERFYSKHQKDMDEVFHREIEELLHHELVQWHNDTLILTERGILLGNQVFMRFV